MSNQLTIPTAAAQRARSESPCTVSPSIVPTVASELILSESIGWHAPTAVTGGSALGTAAFGYATHDVSVAPMSATAVLDARPAAKLTRPPRGVPR